MRSPAQDGKPLVLVVTQDLAIRARLEPVLRLHGFSPRHASTLADAMAVIEATTVDAVVIEAALGGGQHSGDLAAWVRGQAEHENTPLLVLTMGERLSDDEHAVFDEQRAVVFKMPDRIRDVMVFLRRALQS